MSRKRNIRDKGNDDLPKLIQCADHGVAPWTVTCIHLFNWTATEAIAVPRDEGTEVEADWVCTECFERYFVGETVSEDLSDLQEVCMHCLRDILEAYEDDDEEVESPQ